MCGIAGIVTKDSAASGARLKQMLEAMAHRGPDGAGFVIGGVVERSAELGGLDFGARRGHIAIGHVRLAITGEATALQPFQSEDGAITLLHNGEIYNHGQLRERLSASGRFGTKSDSEVIIRLLEKHYEGELVAAMERVFPELDGVFCLAVTDNKTTVIARDRVGVRQLYYCVTDGGVAFASEKKPLMTLPDSRGDIHRLLPGHLARIDHEGVTTRCFWSPESLRSSGRITDKSEALRVYGEAITRAVRKRVAGRQRVGIIFSGGIDSVLIAHLVQRLGVPFTCYTAGRGERAEDLRWALHLADQLGFPLKVHKLTTEDIRGLVPEIIRDIEEHSLNQVEVAVPIYASVRLAQEAGERVILTGQGADELFGGYSWYAAIVDQEGYEEFERRSFEDTFLLYKECLEREDKIAMAHSMELRVPFLDPEVVAAAFRIAPELKIRRGGDILGKIIHREYCAAVGIPAEIACRKKEAAQHGANVHTAFEELAMESGITKDDLDGTTYDPDKSVTEKLGSSSRYGFTYGDTHLWKPLPSVQYYLDTEAARLDMLSRSARQQWHEVSEQLAARAR